MKKKEMLLYIYIWSITIGNKTGIETSDEYIYRRAYAKKLNMAEIEYILKKNAIDCELNKKGECIFRNFIQKCRIR